ncbi:UvrD/REP helicase [Shewanella halifaxensis HAW-EB4]|uniref:DNA 3'-5' helicase n=1 Tax=Shewanella halifaxensis (strain HAW-EB4) TaxID=458817 RepID=B0TT01_SHEHH|nr:UvrD-helicase domain-containing protein [Shewanella halifaxensis]ABZ76562.1 UvrD/REP helicase [Shewanella halifaxensis HAW-EB4]
MELRLHSVEFGFLQGIFFCNSAHLCEQGLTINGRLYPYPEIDKTVEVTQGWFTQTLIWGDKRFGFFRFVDSKPLFRTALNNRIAFCRTALQLSFDNLLVDVTRFDRVFGLHQRYLRDSDKTLLQSEYRGALDAFNLSEHFTTLGFDTSKLNCRLAKFIKQPDIFTERYNQWWQDKQLDAYKNLFDSLEANPLTQFQREACVVDENNTLVIAGAGTGKTSTMAAKAAYLVNQGLAQPQDILMLAYGKDAQVELEQRVSSIAGGSGALTAIKVSTFHALGKEIIEYYLNRSSQVSVLARDEKQFTQFIDQQIDQIVADPQMADPVADYFGRYLYPQVNELAFKSDGQYRAYLKNNEIRALSGDLVKSFQELTICNYLYTHGIEFEYEPKYRVPVTEPGKSVYQPDFYIPVLDAYLEHFGIDKLGNTRPDIDKDTYNQSREWKIALHKRHNTCLMQTFSWQAENGALEKELEALLCKRCEQLDISQSELFKPISPEAVFAQVKALGIYRNVSRLMASFVNLFKSSGMTLSKLESMKLPNTNSNSKSNTKPNSKLKSKTTAKHSAHYNQLRWQAFLHLFSWVITRYQAQLTAHNTLDFSDMIAQALNMAREKDFHQKTAERFRYKYIMVDEFQDISHERADLVKALRDSNPGCALFCVGDDWQAIYRFTGSDLSLTTEFEPTFGATQTIMLDKTFRFNNRIEKVASRFIQANPAQLKKQLKTHSQSDNPEVCLLVNNKQIAIEQTFASIMEVTDKTRADIDCEAVSVMLISRFKSSLKDLSVWQKRYPQLSISGFSAHASKGKQADFVIVLDVNDDKYGFPCKIDSDPILETLLPQLDNYADTEERRLFYVALSRAKQTVFVQAELGKESVFVKELRSYGGDVRCYLSDLAPMYNESLCCPQCKEGKLIPREGRFGLFYTCSLGQDYCDTKIDACSVCNSAPMLRNETHHFCSSEKCGHRLPVCPECISGKLVVRTNSKSGKSFLACSGHKRDDKNSCQYTCNLAEHRVDKVLGTAA